MPKYTRQKIEREGNMGRQKRSLPATPAAGFTAGNELLDRRIFLGSGLASLGAAGGLVLGFPGGARAAGPPDSPSWMQYPGAPFSGYGGPAKYESNISDGEVYNGIIGEADVMDAQSLPKVQMPNRDNFILAYPARPK